MICAIVLAAGRSQRMGTQKLLLPFAGSTVLARVADAFLGAPVDRVFVVVRPPAQELRGALGSRPVFFVENPAPAGDMLSSVRCGLLALPAAAKTVLVSPADQPSLTSGLVRQMLEAYQASGRSLLVPVRHGRRGHPLLFAARFCDELLTSYDGIGLRGLLQAHAAELAEWPSQDPAVLEDLDTPADYQAATAENP
jgi:molybdenum cofactor cytidylyltransferase